MAIIKNNPGITMIGFLFLFATILIGITFVVPGENLSRVNAGIATTSVTVLNTPPNWFVDAQEAAESSAANPTNAGSNVSWTGTAQDPNAEEYYLLICTTGASPTAGAGSAPSCADSQWAVSALTSSSVAATATYTTIVNDQESNAWFAWVCDQNLFNPECNDEYKQGSGLTASPFVVNHRPIFSILTDNSPKLPGEIVQWTAVASDSDTLGATDTVDLFVCKEQGWDGNACTGETYCTALASESNPICTFQLEDIKQDKNYPAYGYMKDSHGFAASGGAHDVDSVLTVANATPSIASASIELLDTDELGVMVLSDPSGTTASFSVKFVVQDANSCQNASSGNEVATASVNVYRSSITQAGCQLSNDYEPNNCYPSAVGVGTWNVVCAQMAGADSCAGPNDDTARWQCVFPLWFVADPTVGTATQSYYWDDVWMASVYAWDDNNYSTDLVEDNDGNEIDTLLSYTLDTSAINYGALEPGFTNPTTAATTQVSANGNIGVDETLYGDDMCSTYPTCPGNPQDTIFVDNQKYATSSVAYGSATALAYNPGGELEINILKTTNVSAPATKNTFWGIGVPGAITLAGDYTGVNTIIGKAGEPSEWY